MKMANSSEFESFTVTGWEIVPYTFSQSMKLVSMEEENENTKKEGVVEALPPSFALPAETAEMQSKEVFLQSTPTQSRLRSSERVNRVNKNFNPLDIFDVRERDEVIASIDHETLLKFLEGWEIETRKRRNGTCDKFYYHGMSKKMLRSLAEVKRFIRRSTYPQGASPQMGNIENGRASLALQSLPMKEVKESITNKDASEVLPVSMELRQHEINTEVQSREIILQSTPTRSRREILLHSTSTQSRLRSSERVNMVDKNFSPSEIFDINELAKVEASIDLQQTLLIYLEHWKVETRKRKNGKFEKFYHHESSGKTLRSLAEVKRFIRRNTFPQSENNIRGSLNSAESDKPTSSKRKRYCISAPTKIRRIDADITWAVGTSSNLENSSSKLIMAEEGSCSPHERNSSMTKIPAFSLMRKEIPRYT